MMTAMCLGIRVNVGGSDRSKDAMLLLLLLLLLLLAPLLLLLLALVLAQLVTFPLLSPHAEVEAAAVWVQTGAGGPW